MKKRCQGKLVLGLLLPIWLSAVGIGLHVLWGYSARPGVAAVAPNDWPRDTELQLDSQRPTLVLFVHPHCPCSSATAGELARLMAQCRDRLTAQVLFVKPSGAPENWELTDLWSTIKQIPGVTVRLDADAKEAKRFGSVTSGQTLLFNPEGTLLFNGGITGSRGEEGDNAGRSSIVSLVGHRPSADHTPVYGCPLLGSQARPASESPICKQ